MAEIKKSVLVEYSASQMFALVDAVEDYPEFLPWCGGASVEPQNEKITHATVKINYLHVKHSFTTENTRHPPELIEMTLLDGPFQHLDGHWRFIPLSDDACKIEFRLHYTFSHALLEKLVGPVFYMIANSFVEAFIERAGTVYGKP
ncbi:Ribosome association toxin PasT (RatA) of the RatAB toxin-antitoxin module [Nitrosomonas cryotolerans]|uniref:Ribosome association toxin PasT (RatA) of the RatAB toxin-antitoxin module n=1 Tax=Nitrosomonas cryotolerans ATCC 49181 TaxID=1131553 RepID=A0A1N6HZY9_9PROT|nr:type II toxin-antitoxin system RatA family toxin [Nitrosomonas cryotolerans]SFQ09274.1 Ribosome association toxin PasT (RatA) of the RatAB toxin-antitoxin module [Nitrosomonas cryotolerans]SIO25362.1 Ribosome association toxin PasT (RatA) of the RatAB toxin-antitoxin module [Nitrosomonas cryotolerans ATCC 49181]